MGFFLVKSNSIAAQNIQRKTPKLSNNAKQFVDLHIKLHGIFEKLEQGTKKHIDDLVETECMNTIKLSNWLTQNPLASEGKIIALNPSYNNFLMMKGEAVFNFACEEIISYVDENIEKDIKKICLLQCIKSENK